MVAKVSCHPSTTNGLTEAWIPKFNVEGLPNRDCELQGLMRKWHQEVRLFFFGSLRLLFFRLGKNYVDL